MEKVICIVTAGDPHNRGFDYGRVSSILTGMFERREGITVLYAPSAKEAVRMLHEDDRKRRDEKWPRGTMTVVYLSAHFSVEAIEMARTYGHDIRFIVYTVGEHNNRFPMFIQRNLLVDETFNAIFM